MHNGSQCVGRGILGLARRRNTRFSVAVMALTVILLVAVSYLFGEKVSYVVSAFLFLVVAALIVIEKRKQ